MKIYRDCFKKRKSCAKRKESQRFIAIFALNLTFMIMKRIIFFLTIVLPLVFLGCSKDGDEATVNKIEVEKTEIAIKINEQVSLKVLHYPSGLSAPEYTYESANKNIATVAFNGVVKGISHGETTITIIGKENPALKAYCKVSVEHIKPTKISLNNSTLNVNVGDSKKLSYTIEPSNTTLSNVEWESSNPNVVQVDESGNITARLLGESNIKVKIIDTDLFATCKIKVLPIYVTGITISVTGLDLNETFIRTNVLIGNELVITPTVAPQNATNKEVAYTSSNTNVADVKLIDRSYRIIAKKKGFSEVKAITIDGNHTATCEVTVVDIDQFATIGMSVKTIFDAFGQHNYLKIHFNTNVSNFVKITSLKVFDNNGNEPFDFTGFPFYKQSYTIEDLPIQTMNINGWRAEINFTWNGSDYTIISK